VTVSGPHTAVGATRGERDPFLDNAKAILIVLVLFTHLFSIHVARVEPARSFYLLILLFHMPAFIFVTGMLSKPYEFTERGARSLGRIVWLYLLFNTLNYLWGHVVFDKPLRLDWILFDPMFALWFLLAMVWWRLLLPFFAVGKSKRSAVLSIVGAVFVSAASGYLIRDSEWGGTLARTLTFLPFYVAGYRVKQMGWSIPRRRTSRVVAVAVFGLVAVALLTGVLAPGSEVLLGRAPYRGLQLVGAPAGFIRLGLLGISAALVFALLQLVPRRRTALTVLGPATLSLYVWHALFVRNIKFFGLTEFFAGNLVAAVLTTVALVVILGTGMVPRITAWMGDPLARKKGA
jgi:fucose 4-O-acetylase-like acetyltransferase